MNTTSAPSFIREDHMVLKYVSEKPARLGDAASNPVQLPMLTIKEVPALYRGRWSNLTGVSEDTFSIFVAICG
jgi:hypothetical protein